MPLKISRILHAGYIFDCDQTQIAFDPIFENPFSQNCHAFPNIEFDQEQIKRLKLDAVFISHYHDDHCSMDSLNLLDRETPIYMFCVFEEIFTLIKKLGFKHVHPLKINSTVKIGSIEIIPRRALDEDLDCLFHVIADNQNILNVVDSWIDYQTLDQLSKFSWDLILWPFQTMREIEILTPKWSEPADTKLPPEWVQQLKTLNPKNIIPSSCQFKMEDWSWYNQAFFPISYKQFETEISEALPSTQVVKLDPSCSIQINGNQTKKTESLSWISGLLDHTYDYEYKPDLKAPHTSEISKHFPALNEIEKSKAIKFCTTDLLKKYRSLETADDSYFSKPRTWHLSTYSHLGEKIDFFYRIDRNEIRLIFDKINFVSWSTEIPLTKLFSALEKGESLTSLYIRINDEVSEIGSFDALEDPLIRCLFNETEFGAYQKNQLKRISP